MPKIHTTHHGKKNKKVIFLIGGWTYKPRLLWLPAIILKRSGYYCITYTYPNDTFSPNYQKTVKDLLEIKKDILLKIKQLKEEGYKTFYVFGTSLGTVLATLVANESSDVSKIILNTTGADTAESVWSWDKINLYFKQDLHKQNITLEKLINHWKPISPQFNMDKLRDKDILIYLSKNDELIPYSQGEKFVEKCKENKYNYRVVINQHLKHGLAGMYNLLNANIYLRFLDEE